jgi:hypothetical protein
MRLTIPAVLALAACTGGTADTPSTADAQKAFEEIYTEEGRSPTPGGGVSTPGVRVQSFKKTNGQAQEIFGAKAYTMEYEAKVELLEDAFAIKVGETHLLYRPNPLFMTSCEGTEDCRELSKGETVTLTGSVDLEKTEMGWRPSQ